MAFIRKADALEYYKNNDKNGSCLFAEDTDERGSKRFHVTKAVNIFNNIKENASSYFYEFWTNNQQIIFSLDLDIVKTDEDENYGPRVVKQSIKNVIKGAKKYYKYDYDVGDFIVLESANNPRNVDKISYHVICRGLVFDNHLVAKDFFLRLKEDFKMEYCDASIYNCTCMRVCFCSKKGKDNTLVPVKLVISGHDTMYPKQNGNTHLFKFWRKTLITYVEGDERLITKAEMKKTKAVLKPIMDENNLDEIKKEDIEKAIFQLPAEYYDGYDTWYKMGMILKNTSESYVDMWDRWSKQSDKYKEGETKRMWESFKNNGNNKLTIGTLIKWCQDCNIMAFTKKKKTIRENVESYPERPIVISDTNYLTLSQAKLEPATYEPFMDKHMIAVQSEKGTGKTSNLLETLFEKKGYIDKDTSVLFVSSRRTFGIKLAGDIKQYGFKLYSDIKEYYISHKRVICQIDSIMRLDREKYDLVVIDECESLARYMTSSHFTKNPKCSIIVSAFKMRVKDGDKVYILDADLSDRCLNFYKNITRVREEDYQLIVNDYKPYQEYTIKYMCYEDWLVKVICDVRANKKLVIPMASNGKAKDLYTKIRNDYPEKRVLLIHKETSDDDKLEKLVNVNDTWNKYDVLIYTPSVCMGVSFDLPDYFDTIYAYGCHMSLGAQEFCQMLHRVRSPKEKTIYMSMDIYKEYDKHEDTISYEDVEEMMCSDYYLTHYGIHTNIVHKEVSRIATDGNTRRDIILKYPYKDDPIYDLYVRNNIEVIENRLSFTASFFGYTKFKQYKIEYAVVDKDKELIDEMKNIHQMRIDEEKDKEMKGIIEAKDITEDEFQQKTRTRDEYLTDGDIYEIKRHNIKKCYSVQPETLTEDFVGKYSNKEMMKWYRNLSTIIKSDDLPTEKRLDILKNSRVNALALRNCYKDFMVKNMYLHHFYAIKVLEHTNIDINNLQIKINVERMKPYIDSFIRWAEPFKMDIAMKFDLKIRNKVLAEMTPRGKMNLLNNIIRTMYGIKFSRKSNDYNITGFDVWDDIPREQKIMPLNLHANIDEFEFVDAVDIALLDEGIEKD